MRKILLFTALLFAAPVLFAQSTSINSVRNVTLRMSDAIRLGNEVKGYYFFYISDKLDKNTNEYTLHIIDNNLKPLKDIKFQDSKDISLLESSFNGTDLAFQFYNRKEKAIRYQLYGSDGNEKSFNYTRELTDKDQKFLEESFTRVTGELTPVGLFAAGEKGFVCAMPSREGNERTFEIDFYGTESKKQWTYIPPKGGVLKTANYLGYHNGIVYVQMMRYKSIFNTKAVSSVLGLDVESGQQLFETSTDSKYRFYPASVLAVNDGKAYLYGEYFDANANITEDKSLGFAFWSVDNKGKIMSEKYSSWETDLGRYLNVADKGKIENFGNMYLHNLVQTADGTIYAIGEGYNYAEKSHFVFNGNINNVHYKITNLLLMKFDHNFALKDVKVYEKQWNTIELPGYFVTYSTPMFGRMVRDHFGGFDYQYTQNNKDASVFTVCYANYARGKDYKGGTFNSITYNEGKFTTDQVHTKEGATYSWLLPGKQGQTLILDYFKNEMRLDVHLEKIN